MTSDRFGGITRKPTCLSGTLEGLADYHETRCQGGHVHGQSQGTDNEGRFHTRHLQTYPTGLCALLAQLVCNTLEHMNSTGSGPTGWRRSISVTARVSGWSLTTSTARPNATAVLDETAVQGQ